MRVKFAHLRQPSTSGGDINFAVFDANATNNSDAGRSEVLANLTMKARLSGLRVDQSALAYSDSGRIRFYGSTHLVEYLAKRGVPGWTNYMDI